MRQTSGKRQIYTFFVLGAKLNGGGSLPLLAVRALILRVITLGYVMPHLWGFCHICFCRCSVVSADVFSSAETEKEDTPPK